MPILGDGSDSASNGASRAANINVPNTVVQQTLGRLTGEWPGDRHHDREPAHAGQLYGGRITQVDMRFAKILRFGRTRADVGVDLYNLFNTNDANGFIETYDYATNGAT